VNKDIRGLYEWVQRIMSEADYCKRDESIAELWTINNRIISKMQISMMQMLIHSMFDENQFYLVPVYARAIIPQLSQCRTVSIVFYIDFIEFALPFSSVLIPISYLCV